ncbi:hypothetical protein ACJX0J_020004, partial [Zea mays]
MLILCTCYISQSLLYFNGLACNHGQCFGVIVKVKHVDQANFDGISLFLIQEEIRIPLINLVTHVLYCFMHFKFAHVKIIFDNRLKALKDMEKDKAWYEQQYYQLDQRAKIKGVSSMPFKQWHVFIVVELIRFHIIFRIGNLCILE